jgi:hypothetical protein
MYSSLAQTKDAENVLIVVPNLAVCVSLSLIQLVAYNYNTLGLTFVAGAHPLSPLVTPVLTSAHLPPRARDSSPEHTLISGASLH